jgi:predicted O-methyltransferase YrrM
MKNFRGINYLSSTQLELDMLKLRGKEVSFLKQKDEYKPSEKIKKLYQKFEKEFENGDIKNLYTEPKPWVGYYLYSLIKENDFHNILQIGVKNGIDTLYLALGLKESEVPEKYKQLTVITGEEEWMGKLEKNVDLKKDIDVPITIYDEKNYSVLSEMVEKGLNYDFIMIKNKHVFDYALMDFFYADKLLQRDGVLILFDVSFDSIQKLGKYIQTNFMNYKMFPINLGSKYCYTFVKFADDGRQWFFHINF